MIKEGYTRVSEVYDVYSKMHMVNPDVLENSQIRGNAVDEACKCLMQGLEPFHLDEIYKHYLDSFKQFNEGIKWIPHPGRWYCDKLKLTGECDAIYEKDGILILVDLKTSAAESRSWPLQGAAYCYLAREVGIDIQGIKFIRLKDTGKAPSVYSYEFEPNWDLFRKALDLHRYFFDPKKKKLDDEKTL
jgi:hypothetical protein